MLFLFVILSTVIQTTIHKALDSRHKEKKTEQITTLQTLLMKWQQRAIYPRAQSGLDKIRFLSQLLNSQLSAAPPLSMPPRSSSRRLYPVVALRWVRWFKVASRLAR